MILLIRHARAGHRSAWSGDDRSRPLDGKGRRQAEQLVQLLEPYELERILSSPALRCVQTVEPVALARGLEVEVRDELGEELQSSAGVQLLRSLGEIDVAVSCHAGVSEAICGEHQKKGQVFVLDGETVVERIRAKG
jgi:phosphohistidine phosphatase SixA